MHHLKNKCLYLYDSSEHTCSIMAYKYRCLYFHWCVLVLYSPLLAVPPYTFSFLRVSIIFFLSICFKEYLVIESNNTQTANKDIPIAKKGIDIGLCLVGVVIGEFISSRRGLGYMIIYGSQIMKLDWVILGIVILCLIAMGLYQLIVSLEKWYLKKV